MQAIISTFSIMDVSKNDTYLFEVINKVSPLLICPEQIKTWRFAQGIIVLECKALQTIIPPLIEADKSITHLLRVIIQSLG